MVVQDDMVAEVCNEMLHGNWCLTDVRQASNQIMAVSTGFQVLTGYTAAELLGKSPSRVLHGPHTRQEVQLLRRNSAPNKQHCGCTCGTVGALDCAAIETVMACLIKHDS